MTLHVADAHCHFQPGLDPDRQTSSATETACVAGRILCGTSQEGWPGLRGVRETWPGTVAAYGIHPWYAGRAEDTWPAGLIEALDNDPTAWVGEIGLDAVRRDASLDSQILLFEQQIAIAKEGQRHTAIHCVRAWNQLQTALRQAGDLPLFLLHAFTGPEQMIPELVAMGAYFSAGPLNHRHDSERTRKRLAALPTDRIVLESDAVLAPPSDAVSALTATLRWLAEVLHIDAVALAEITTANYRRLCHGT